MFLQPNYVVNKIKSCSKLEKDTDVKLKSLKEHNPKIQFDDNLIGALKGKYTILELGHLSQSKEITMGVNKSNIFCIITTFRIILFIFYV